jgi:hypothetical protein
MPEIEEIQSANAISQPPPGPLQACTERGFKYPVFISWPHQMRDRGVEIVRALAAGLENRFRDDGGAEVFLDTERIKPSYVWNETLRIGICRSAVTIVFLLRTYFQSEFCCTEWAITEELARLRIARDKHRVPIIPVMLAKNVPLPREVGQIQFEDDFQQLLVYGRDPTTHDKWHKLIEDIAQQIFELIEDVCETERDWPEEEKIAMAAGPRKFTWAVPVAKPRAIFPSISVEKPAA